MEKGLFYEIEAIKEIKEKKKSKLRDLKMKLLVFTVSLMFVGTTK